MTAVDNVVTRDEAPQLSAVDSRNARIAALAEEVAQHRAELLEAMSKGNVAAELAWVFGRWSRRSDEQIAAGWMKQRARQAAGWCARCGRELAPMDPVWWFRSGGDVAVVGKCCEPRPPRCGMRCRKCFGRGTCGWEPHACEFCGRTVHYSQTDAPYDDPKHPACCESHKRSAESSRRREMRAQARADRKCGGCGATFTPKRADGRFCSGACRQFAYRQRKASRS